MVSAEEQRKEIETIKKRTVTFNLSDADCKRLSELCGEHGVTVGTLFENFIGDLVNGTYTNGSDERMYARQWFERCWFGAFPEKTLLHDFLVWGIDVEEFLDLMDDIEKGQEDLKNHEINPGIYDEEEIEFLKDDLENWQEEYHQCINEFVKEHPEADLKKEIEGCRKWWKDYQMFLGAENE